ncbi:hypothetical protein [Propionispora hippei]|uniref:Uncharacterized protein n=1 Tax=Propionispora hippei DSM 15287 TaxID=1123003 RepID=A0A1M6LJL0_9FIRM|nr:hypothetical protein [Propionispora hippei]SHJ71374.1 hypothetical protein SAMN02745170_03138 [Propionispora hippei DSM 15287]
MKTMDRGALITEAAMQTKMVRNLERWFSLLLALSGIGVVFLWWGANNENFQRLMQVSGGSLAVASFGAALIVKKGISNGKENIEKILRLAESDYS